MPRSATMVFAAPQALAQPKQRHWSDWAGCTFFLTLAVVVVLRAPEIGLMLLPSMLYDVALAASFLTRRPLRRQLASWPARIATYLGTMLLPAFGWMAATFRPEWTATTRYLALLVPGVLLWILTSLVGTATIWYMRHSFSLLPQARQLVTTGPYRWARHPLYALYLAQYVGIWLTRPTVPLAFVTLLWLVLTAVRMRMEERVLASVYPEYAEYRERVPALGVRWPFTARARKATSAAANRHAA